MPSPDLPIYKIVDGKLVRKDSDVRDPSRRYAQTSGPQGEYLREFTDEEERQRDEEEARWAAEAPQRELERQRQQREFEAFRASLQYDIRLVAFIDILGWTDAVRTSPANAENARRLGLALSTIRRHAEVVTWRFQGMDADDELPGDPHVSQFSDCLVMSARPDSAGKSSLVMTLGSLSTNLLWQGFVLRGGITRGPLYHRDSVVFGPAFLTAYELENRWAIYPRIILDPVLSAEWGQGDRYLDGNGHEIGRAKTWRLSDDGYWFFDFLQPLGGGPDFAKPSLIRDSLEPLRDLLLHSLRAYRESPKVLAKYLWLANYFNAICREHFGHGVDPIADVDLNPTTRID